MSTTTALPTLDITVAPISEINTENFGDKQWSTYLSKFDGNINKSMFDAFGHEEVVNRVNKVTPDLGGQMVSIISQGDRILTVNKPDFELLQPSDIQARALDLFPNSKISYSDGAVKIVDNMNMPDMAIGGEGFNPMWQIEYHADGYGKNQWTAFLMRLACANGMMMQDSLTSSNMNISNGLGAEAKGDLISRLMVSAQNPDKAYALTDRIDEVQNVYASVRELNQLKNAAFGKDGTTSKDKAVNAWLGQWLMDQDFKTLKLTGNKAAMTPTNVPLYDVLNISSEIASHYDVREEGDMVKGMGALTAKILKKGPDLPEIIGGHKQTEYRATFTKESDISDANAVSKELLDSWLEALQDS